MLGLFITNSACALSPDPCDVVWTSPSKDASGSMPLGNGELGINLWVEENGDLNFYISRSDSFSEISRLLKVGQVRIAISPNPFISGAPFQQHLHLHDGVCEIVAGDGASKVALHIFVNSDQPVVHVIGESASPILVKVTVECWRTEQRILPKKEQGSAWSMHDAPFDLIESADIFPPGSGDSVTWYHRNQTSAVPSTVQVQSLQSIQDKIIDPLLHRTFGGVLKGENFGPVGDRSIQTVSSVQNFSLRVAAPCEQTDTADHWVQQADKIAVACADSTKAMQQTTNWWHNYWDRSWVFTNAGVNDKTPISPISLAYTLQRYVQGCEGRGTYPIKFNGGIFTVEPKAMGLPFNADYRAWGDCFWWQNTRHMYHPMLASGDIEMMDPLFKMYQAARPLAEARTQLYHHVQGCYFPETMSIWGTYSNGDYGWNRQGHQPDDVQCKYWRWAWNQGPEIVGILLDRWEYTKDSTFLTEQLLPMANSVLTYFDTRFKRDSAGKIILDPTQSVETFWSGVINDTPTIAGLNDITTRLCNLPESLTTEAQRTLFTRMKAVCPPVATEEKTYDAQTVKQLAPAEKYDTKRSNVENPELYAVWPFRLFGIGKPGLDLAINAYTHRVNHLDVGWGPDGNCAALLGLTDESARILTKKCANSRSSYRWPATWGPNFDWLPDQNHGGNLLETTQLMLLQCDGQKIRLLPAWPKQWDVSFKLHATDNTLVECVYRGGKIESLNILPTARRKDVVIPQ